MCEWVPCSVIWLLWPLFSPAVTQHTDRHNMWKSWHAGCLSVVFAGISPDWVGINATLRHSVGPEWSAGFLRLRLFRFPAVGRGRGKKDAIVAQASRKLRETPFAFISWKPAEGRMKGRTFWKASGRLPPIHIEISFQEEDIRFRRHPFVSILCKI